MYRHTEDHQENFEPGLFSKQMLISLVWFKALFKEGISTDIKTSEDLLHQSPLSATWDGNLRGTFLFFFLPLLHQILAKVNARITNISSTMLVWFSIIWSSLLVHDIELLIKP